MKHVVAIYEVPPPPSGAPLTLVEEGFVEGSNLDVAKAAAARFVEAKGKYKIRTLSFATDGRILVYVTKAGPYRRKRTIQASALGG